MNSSDQLLEAEKALLQIFSGIDTQVKHNLKRVLEAFRYHKVGAHHFAGVTGYGHDDLGRETLDKVFAQVMGAEAAVVRVQFVSGTHAIACALFGVLRPGDEMLAVARYSLRYPRRGDWFAGSRSRLTKRVWHQLPTIGS